MKEMDVKNGISKRFILDYLKKNRIQYNDSMPETEEEDDII